MKNFIVVIGQIVESKDYAPRYNINFYKVRGESREDIENKIKGRVDFWSDLRVSVEVIDIIDLEETQTLRREVEFLGNYWLLPKHLAEENKKGQ